MKLSCHQLSLKILASWMAIWILLPADAMSAQIKMGFGDKLQPFCIPENHSGIEVEIVREALGYKGHILTPVFLPIKRVPQAFIAKKVSAAMMDSGTDLAPFGGVYATHAVLYDNVFITLKKRNLKVSEPSDLNGLTVLAFPGALERFPEWLKPVAALGHYREVNDQSLQVKALLNGRYDVVLSDRMIFRYFMRQYEQKMNLKFTDINEHDFVVANPKDYRLIFKDKKIADDYEAGLKHLKKTGRYQEIYKHFSD